MVILWLRETATFSEHLQIHCRNYVLSVYDTLPSLFPLKTMFGLNRKKGGGTTSSLASSLSLSSSWKKKYEEEAKSKFNLLLQVQEQQRIIQEQRRIIENLRSKVSELEIAQKDSIMTEAKSENTVNTGENIVWYQSQRR